MYISNNSTINIYSYNSYEQATIRMIPLIFTYFSISYASIIFRRVRNISMSFAVCVRSVCIEQLGSHCTDFHEILYLSIFRKYVHKI